MNPTALVEGPRDKLRPVVVYIKVVGTVVPSCLKRNQKTHQLSSLLTMYDDRIKRCGNFYDFLVILKIIYRPDV